MRSTKLASLLALLMLVAACGGNGNGDGGADPDDQEAGGDASDDGSTGELEDVLLTLNWVPYGEHAPLYYGLQQGFFEEEGLNLTIRAGGGSGRTVEAVAGQHTDFGWADAPVMLRGVGEGMEIKSVGSFMQQGPASIEFFADQNISEPADLVGKQVAGTPGDAMYSIMEPWLELNGVDPSEVEIVNVDPAGKVSVLVEEQVDAIQGFFHDQAPNIADQTGRDVEYLKFADFGMNLMSNGLLVHDEFIAESPELIEAMVRATVRSFEEAEENPDDAVAAMGELADATYGDEVLMEQMQQTFPLLSTDCTEGERHGINCEEDWQETIDLLAEYADLPNPGSPSDYWDPSFEVE